MSIAERVGIERFGALLDELESSPKTNAEIALRYDLPVWLITLWRNAIRRTREPLPWYG